MRNSDLIHKGITYLGKHSYRDFRITIAERIISYPSKNKNKVSVPYSNTEHDFSALLGFQTYSNREVVYKFNIAGNKITDPESMYRVKDTLINWLMGNSSKSELYDDYIDNYHFHGEVEDSPDISEDWSTGTVNVTFNCYPFKISDFYEGDDVWDLFDFEYGAYQQTKIRSIGNVYNMNLTALKEGDRVVFAPWGSNVLSKFAKTQIYTVKKAYTVSDDNGTRNLVILKENSGIAYNQAAFLQALEFVEFELINTSANSVILPDVTIRLYEPGYSSVAIELDGTVHNLYRGEPNTTFRLKPGINRMKLYGFGAEISFKWRREML